MILFFALFLLLQRYEDLGNLPDSVCIHDLCESKAEHVPTQYLWAVYAGLSERIWTPGDSGKALPKRTAFIPRLREGLQKQSQFVHWPMWRFWRDASLRFTNSSSQKGAFNRLDRREAEHFLWDSGNCGIPEEIVSISTVMICKTFPSFSFLCSDGE